jgi:2-polyprenyl-3-methyl-5-hydroxy-6-metoxy-1,4-benzoquinol methylase
MIEIDGFKCYSPDLAIQNTGFDPKSFELLFKVEDKSFWFINRNKILQHLLEKFPVEQNFLEIGCGSAYVINHLNKKLPNIEFTGSEIYLEGLKLAKLRVSENVKLIQFDATELIFNEKYDGIGAFDVIEHIDDDELVLSNIYKALKPNGRIFISVPQYMFMWSQADDAACHKRRYTKKELTNKLVEAGFKVEYVSSYMFLLFPLMVISRLIGNKTKKSDEEMIQALYPGKFLNSFLNLFAYFDYYLIKMGISLPYGGSLLAVAKK